jgi:hypothetical protein
MAIFAGIMLRDYENNRKICERARPAHVELVVRQLGAAASIAAWMGCTWPSGGFGSRAFLRYRSIDYESKIPRTFKWLIALELLVHETRQRECSKAKDRIIAPLAFAMHEKFVPELDNFRLLEAGMSILGYSLSMKELYCRFTHFMINSMASLDILSRAHRNDDGQDKDSELSLPSWVPPFHIAGSNSLIDELLFTQYDAARHLNRRREGKLSDCRLEPSMESYPLTGVSKELLELPVQAIFFGEIYKILRYAAAGDTIVSWFSNVQNLPDYQTHTETESSCDIAYMISRTLEDIIHQDREIEMRCLRNRQEFLRHRLSACQ